MKDERKIASVKNNPQREEIHYVLWERVENPPNFFRRYFDNGAGLMKSLQRFTYLTRRNNWIIRKRTCSLLLRPLLRWLKLGLGGSPSGCVCEPNHHPATRLCQHFSSSLFSLSRHPNSIITIENYSDQTYLIFGWVPNNDGGTTWSFYSRYSGGISRFDLRTLFD